MPVNSELEKTPTADTSVTHCAACSGSEMCTAISMVAGMGA